MIKKILKGFRIVQIDVFIYKMDRDKECNLPKFKYVLNKERLSNKWYYYVTDDDKIVHASYLFDNVFLLRLIGKRGPVIGDCFTNKQYRGQSIYPLVINSIAKETLESGVNELFIIVDQNNISSIKGIEKAGFEKLVSIRATRWLWFYFKKQIVYFKPNSNSN